MNWEAVSLGDILTLKRGYDLPTTKRQPGPYPVVSSSGITGRHNEAKVEPPGVITGRYGTLGEVFYLEEPFWPLNTTLYVQDFKGNDPRWVSYLLRTLGFADRSGAAAVPGVNRNALHTLSARRPPRMTQQRIAAVLTAYDQLIENNVRRIEILEVMVQVIYREWFIDFRFPGHERVSSTVPTSVAFPKGWTNSRVDELADIIRGRSYRKSEVPDSGGLPFFNLKCIKRGGGFRKLGIKRYTGRYKPSQVTRPGDIVVAVTDMTQERNVVARAARIPQFSEDFGVISLDLARIVPKDVDRNYLYGTLRYSSFSDEVKNYANGANVLHLSPDRIGEYRVPHPPPDLQAKYSQAVEPMYALADGLDLQIENLRRTRDLLLPRLISGEIDLSELDIDISWLAA